MGSETETIDILKKKRSVFRRNTTRTLNKIAETGEEKVDPKELKRYAVQLKEKRKELKELDEKVLDYLLENEDEDACDKEVETQVNTRRKSRTH